MTFPRYTTFAAGELEDTLKNMGVTNPHAAALEIRTGRSTNPNAILLKNYDCSVTYPDGVVGTCTYLRGAPKYHRFTYYYPDETHPMSRRILAYESWLQTLDNTGSAIEEKAQEMAEKAFLTAAFAERRDHFLRISKPRSEMLVHVTIPKPQTSVKQAKVLKGKYALCLEKDGVLTPEKELFDTQDQANAAWRSHPEQTKRVIGCFCCWSRAWERPTFNALYVNPEYPKKP